MAGAVPGRTTAGVLDDRKDEPPWPVRAAKEGDKARLRNVPSNRIERGDMKSAVDACVETLPKDGDAYAGILAALTARGGETFLAAAL